MAKIKLGKTKNIELEITPLSVWQVAGSEEEYMKYQVSFSVDGKNILNLPDGTSLFTIKEKESDFLADYFTEVLEKSETDKTKNWFTVASCPVDSFCLQPVFISENESENNFVIGLFVSMKACVAEGIDVTDRAGIWIDLGEASSETWRQFADQLYQEEENAPETTDEAAPAVEKPAQAEPWHDIFSQEVEISRHKR